MNRTTVLFRIQRFGKWRLEILGVAASSLTDESSPETIDQWDSLNHLQLITAIEQRFDLTLPMAAVMEIQDMGSLSRIVQSHL